MFRSFCKIRTTLRTAVQTTVAFAGLALALTASAAGQLIETNDPLSATMTRFRVLNIPFELHSAKEHTREVQLLVSRDGGVSWNVEKSVAPQAAKFEFAADHDGEYWFSVRTIDRLGNMVPAGTPQPEARILIDSTPPRLQLNAALEEDGRVAARWQCDDPRLLEGSLRLEYRAVGDTDWLEFPLDPLLDAPDNTTSGGRISWLPPMDGQWELRAVVADTAGNQALVVQSAAATSDAANAQQLHSAIPPESTSQLPTLPARNTNLKLGPAASGDANAVNAANTFPSAAVQGDHRNQAWSADNFPASMADRSPRSSDGFRSARSNSGSNQLGSESRQGDGKTASESDRYADTANRGPVRPIGLTNCRDRELEPRQIVPSVGGMMPQEPTLYVNSLGFGLDFDPRPTSVALDAADAIRDVELWGTIDGGQTWRRFAQGRSSDARLTVNVANSGRYGFRLVEIDRAALQLPPRSGDRPEVWVIVDLSPPVCQLINATQGNDQHLDEMTITWSASDEQLAAGAITLQYGATAAGPWETIVQGAENTGTYMWRMTSGVPMRFHLRLLAQDMAGNYGEYVSQVPVEPIRRDSGRITGIHAINGTDAGQQVDRNGTFHSAGRDR